MAQRNLLLMVVAVGCGLGAAFLTTRINAKPKIEQIEVYVAAKNLPVGTVLSKEELQKNLLAKKAVPKDALPPTVVLKEEDLLDRRLTRSIQAGEFITSNALTKGSVITLPDGMDMVTLPVNTTAAVAGFVGPGTRVDVLATYRQGNRLEAFPLLVDMLVLAVDTHASYESTPNKGGGAFTNVSSVSFAVTQEQALILKMAEHAGCHLSLLLRNPNKKSEEAYDPEQVKKRLRALILPSRVEETSNSVEGNSPTTPAVTPQVPQVETVKVWVATDEIPAGTLFTKELLKEKFVEKEIPKEFAAGAITDPATANGQLALKTIVTRNQWLAEGMLGPPPPKPAPREEFQPPKTEVAGQPKPPATQPEPKQPTAPARRPIREIAVHTANRTEIYRYEEVRPGEWRLKEKLTAEQNNASVKEDTPERPKEGTSPDTPPNPEGKPSGSKVE
jgi:Flp pilus assembly protein CpaB